MHVDRGARITSLRSDDDYEWLAASERTEHAGPGQDFVRAGMGGWDEVAPTVQSDYHAVVDGAADVAGSASLALPDHGDIWNVAWQLHEATATTLTASVQLASVPVTLHRTIAESENGLRLSYTASTESDAPQPLLWCAHPQFDARDDATLTLESAGLTIAPTLIEAYPTAGRTRVFPTPPLHHSLAAGSSFKAFLEPTRRADAAVLRVGGANGRALRLAWNSEQLPYLGLFWDNGEFASEPVIAIEPSTAWGERLSVAVQQNRVRTVTRDAPVHWSLELAALPR